MIETLQLSEEFTCGPARLRVDVHGSTQLEHVLADMNFLNYRLAEVGIAPAVTLPEADLVWRQDGEQSVSYDGRRMTFTGPWNVIEFHGAFVCSLPPQPLGPIASAFVFVSTRMSFVQLWLVV